MVATPSINRRRIWWALGITLGAVFLVVAGLVWVGFDAFGACRDVVLGSTPSPDGRRSVVIFSRGCNATVADSSHASIISAGESFSAQKHPPFLSLARTSDILAFWRGNNVVEIALIPGGIREVTRESRVQDVQIEYK
jgi:hypothetical protein